MASAKNRRTKKFKDYGKPGPVPKTYLPRNTHMRGDGVYVHGKLVCEPRGEHVRDGSFFTPKGTKPIKTTNNVTLHPALEGAFEYTGD